MGPLAATPPPPSSATAATGGAVGIAGRLDRELVPVWGPILGRATETAAADNGFWRGRGRLGRLFVILGPVVVGARVVVLVLVVVVVGLDAGGLVLVGV